jgi:hypothetical protein
MDSDIAGSAEKQKKRCCVFSFRFLASNGPAFRLKSGSFQIFEMAKTQLVFRSLAGAVCFTPLYLFNIFITAYNHGLLHQWITIVYSIHLSKMGSDEMA